MCKKNSPQKNKAITGCVRKTPNIKTRETTYGMCKRNYPDKNETNMGWVRESPLIQLNLALDV